MSVWHGSSDLNLIFMAYWSMLSFLGKDCFLETIINRSTIFGLVNDCEVYMYFSFGLTELDLIFLKYVKFMCYL